MRFEVGVILYGDVFTMERALLGLAVYFLVGRECSSYTVHRFLMHSDDFPSLHLTTGTHSGLTMFSHTAQVLAYEDSESMHILLAIFLAGLLWNSSTCCFVLYWNFLYIPTPTKAMLATFIEMFSNTNFNSDPNSGSNTNTVPHF